MRSSMRVLAKEHLALRALARIIALEAELLSRDGRADLDLLQDIAAYISEFPNRIHHPKEDDFLFRHMRARDSARCAAIIDRLQSEHQKEDESIARFLAALQALRAGAPGAAEDLAEVAAGYARHLLGHIEAENSLVFPLAEEVLQDEDWVEIDAAFAANDDPLVGGQPGARFSDLHRRIMAIGALPPGL